jgi:hypothetical protein
MAMVLPSYLVQGMLGFRLLRAIARRAYPKGYFRLLEAPAGVDLPRQAQAVAHVGASLALLGAWLHFASLLSWPG